MDHLINTAFISFFAVLWYFDVPHDGRRVANSDAQRELMESGGKLLGETEALRKLAAELTWREERGFAAAVIVAGWFMKVSFPLIGLDRGLIRWFLVRSTSSTASIPSLCICGATPITLFHSLDPRHSAMAVATRQHRIIRYRMGSPPHLVTLRKFLRIPR